MMKIFYPNAFYGLFIYPIAVSPKQLVQRHTVAVHADNRNDYRNRNPVQNGITFWDG